MTTPFTFPIRSDKLSMTAAISTVAEAMSPFQRIEIVASEALGRMLFLDGHVQLAQRDEHAYHEALVHVPLLNVAQPSSALVIGGGDGGVLRELCRWPSMTRIDMVEIDETVVNLCREHLPELSAGAFDDPRVHLHIADAFVKVKELNGPYDLIIVDATDTYEEEDGELSEALFTDAFYADLKRLLARQGFVVTQADNLVFCPYSLEDVRAMFGRVFPHVQDYWAIVPSFGGFSGFCVASHGAQLSADYPAGTPDLGLRYLNPITYALGMRPHRFELES